MNYKIKVNGEEYEVDIQKVEGSTAHLTVNEVNYEVEVEGLSINPTRMSNKQSGFKTAQLDAPSVQVAPITKPTSSVSAAYEQRSPLPGVIVSVGVKVGDKINSGDVLVVIEAMKMENNIEAEKGGVIEQINCNPGDSVAEGDVLFIIK